MSDRTSNSRAKWLLAVAALACACGKSESGTIDLIKNVASEARTKPRVTVVIRPESPPAEAGGHTDAQLLKTLEDRIEQAHIGRLVSSSSESGFLNITVEVENTADAATQLRQVLQSAGVLNRATLRVSSGGQ